MNIVERESIEVGRENEPWLSVDAIDFLKGYLKPNMRVLEFGGGASTLWFAKKVEVVCCVEYDRGWAEHILSEGDRLLEDGNGIIVMYIPHNKDYSDALEKIKKSDDKFDLILVDGESPSRFPCARFALTAIKEGGVIMVDDVMEHDHIEVLKLMQEKLGEGTISPIGHRTGWWVKK